MFAIRTGPTLSCMLLGLLAAGCVVENEHSIIDKPAPPDKRIVGVWALEADGGAQVLMLREDGEANAPLQSTYVIVPNDEPPATSRADVAFTMIGGRSYFEANWKIGEWLPLDPPVRRTFGTYELSGGRGAETLKLCLADAESFETPVKTGALSGFSGSGDSYERRVVLAADTAALRAYLAKNHFECSVSATFRRLTGPEQSRQ